MKRWLCTFVQACFATLLGSTMTSISTQAPLISHGPERRRVFEHRAGFLAALALCVLTGCSTLDVPRADNYPATSQKKARAIHHWDVLADDVAQRIAEKLRDWPPGEHPIHVSASGDTTFNQGFRKLLMTRLLDRGITLSTQPTGVDLVFETQLVEHPGAVYSMVPMPLTQLTGGVAVARDWRRHVQTTASMVPGALVAAAALDVAQLSMRGSASGGPTRTEVLVTTSIESGNRFLARTADVYYIDPEDVPLYQVKEPPPPPPPPPPPTPLRTWQVVAP